MENAVTNNGVLNGTALHTINEPIIMYIEQFKTFGKSGAESIIKQCETVVSAEEQLSTHNFKRFLVEIDVEKSSSTYRKMKSIGKAAVRFKGIADRLPNEWTTLYALSVLENAEFDDLVQNNVIKPRMTAKELNAALNKESEKKEEFKITIDVSGCEIGRKADFVKFIQANVASFGVTAKFTEALKQCVEQFSVSVDENGAEGRV
jgi:hypothetical protein